MRKFFGFFKGMPEKLRDYWRRLYDSPKKKMSKGASNIAKTISWARDENWRRKEIKKTPKNK